MKSLRIKNFEKYQHYKQRNPPWIKLHLEILDDPDFLALPDASKWHYIGLLLIASRHGNDIKPNWKYIQNRLGLTSKVDLSRRFLKEHVLASNAIHKALSINSEFGDSETETEAETEAEEITPIVVPIKKRGKRPISEEDKPSEKHFTYGQRIGVDVGPEWGKFVNYCKAHDRRYADFEAAFRNWIANAANFRRGGAHAL